MTDIFEELFKFREKNKLIEQSFDLETYLRKDYEEGLELQGFSDTICKNTAANYANIMVENIKLWSVTKEKGRIFSNDYVKADALCDRIVLAVEALEQLGFDANLALLETAKEINSRDGEIINGKFEKYKTPEAITKWYKANYHSAKRKTIMLSTPQGADTLLDDFLATRDLEPQT
jgi:hypothetical protein